MDHSQVISMIRDIISDIPALSARLFWLRAFGIESHITWSRFLNCFLNEYEHDIEPFCSEVIEIFHTILMNLTTQNGVNNKRNRVTSSESPCSEKKTKISLDKTINVDDSSTDIDIREEIEEAVTYGNKYVRPLPDFVIRRDSFAAFCEQ